MNLAIREFSETIRQFVHKSSLPIEAKRLALNEIAQEVQQQASAELLKEIEERDRGEEKNHAKSI